MCSKIMKALIVGLILVFISNTVLLEKLGQRVNRLEAKERSKGEVAVFLEPASAFGQAEYNGPRLYNNHTKIILNDEKEFTCLAENVFYESGHQPYLGKIAVLQTVFNRAESGKWGYSFCNVIHADKQFSWTLYQQKKPYGPAWKASKDAVHAFLNGVRVSSLTKSDHYHADYVSPYWDVHMKKSAVIGNHIFYASGYFK